MRKRLAWLLRMTVFLLITGGKLCAQSITIDAANFSTGPYGAGGSITVPVKLSSCFGPGTTFSLYLSDVGGSFPGGGTLIGGYSLFFTPFVNGTLPSNIAAGSYKLRVVASSGEQATTPSFNISGSATVIDNLKDANSNVFAGNDSTYGICPGNNPPDSIIFAFQDPQKNVNDILVLDSTGKKQNVQNIAGTFVFTGFVYNYYTVQAQIKNSAGIVSARSFLVMLSSVNAGIQTSGKIEICRPSTVSFSLNYNSSGGIQYNYPSTLYTVGWGDGSTNATPQCQLIAQKGKLSHLYDTTSCGQTDIDTIHNAFSVTISASNQFCPTSFSQANSIVKVFENPTAIIQGFALNCYSDTITLCGTASLRGEAAPNNAVSCDNPSLKYKWYINQTSFPNSTDSCYSPTNFNIGSNFVKLVVNNGVCQDDTIVKFCLDPKPKPSFLVNGAHSASGCSPLTVKTTNLSNANTCSGTVYHWFITDSLNGYPVKGVDYTVSPNDSAFQPIFKFITPNKYYIHLYFQNSCTGPYIYDTVEIVTITGTASVTLPPTQKYCGLKTINFGTDPNHKPTYNSNQGNEKYYWSVTGGSFSFAGGTTAQYQYPQIQFNSYGSYIVKDSFVNNCGVTTAQQQIIFSQGDSVRASTGKSDTSVCFSTAALQLNGVEVGPADSTKWFTGGTGTFSNNKILNPVYTFSGADKTTGEVDLVLTAYAKKSGACPVVSDTLHVTIFPDNTGVDTAETVCSNTPFQYKPHSAIDTSTYNWKSVVVSGTISGNTPSGTGLINEVLVNKSNSTNGVVNYIISPLANGCSVQPYNFKVTVNATPVLKAVLPKDTICSGTDINLQITGSVKGLGTSYLSLPQAAITGNTSNPTVFHQDTIYIHDVLVNTSTTNQVVTYIITPFGVAPNECQGKADTINVVVKPGATPAMAGNDTLLCNQPSVILNANTPAVGTGTWKQVTNFPVTIVNPNNPHSTVTGLQANSQYQFSWQIVGSGACGSSSSAVTITNRPEITKAKAGKDSVICTYNEGTQVNINLHANADTSRHFETGAWNIVAQPTGSTSSFSNINSPQSQFTINQSGVYSLQWVINNDAGCTPVADTVLYSIFATPSASAPATADTNVCSGNSITITLPQYTGMVEKWQTKQQPYKTSAWQDVANTTSTVTFPAVQNDFMVRAVLVSAGAASGCNMVVESDSLRIHVAPPVNAGKTSGGDTVCGGGNKGTILLSGNIGAITKWQYSVNNGASWVDTANTTNKQPYANLTTTTWFRAVVQSGQCFSAYSDTAVVAIAGFATKANAGGNDSLCGTKTALLTANSPAANEVGAWKQISGVTATLSSASAPSLTLTGLQNGKYGFEWSINNHICPVSRDTAYVLIYPALTDSIADTTITVCKGVSVTINGPTPTGSTGTYTYAWQQSTDGGNTWADINGGGLQNLTFIPDTTMLVRRVVYGGPCSSNGNTVAVTVQASISNNTVQQSQAVCINTAPALIVGSLPTGANGNFKYQWQQSTDGGVTWNDIIGEINKDFQPGKLTATVLYRRMVSTQLCSGLQASASAPVTMTVENNAKAVFNYLKDTGCAPFLIDASNITATDFSDRNGTYKWFANNRLIGQGLAFPSYNLVNNNDSVQIKLLAISQFGCLSDSTEQTFFTLEKPVPSFSVSDTAGCGPLTVNFTNTTPDKEKFQFTWDFGNGATATATDAVSAIFPPSPSYTDTTYTVTLSAVNVCNTVSFTKNILVHSKPKASFTPDSSFNCSPRMVVFTNNSLGNKVSYTWDFGDGSSLKADNSHTVTHTYHSKDSIVYVVKLAAQNNCGTDTALFSISVNPNTVDLHFSEEVAQLFNCTGKAVTFINNTRGATIFNWNFGDPASGSNNTLVTETGVGRVTHTYNTPGTYVITLCAGNGCTQDTCTTQTIQVKQTPTAKFDAPAEVCTGDVVHFRNQSLPADSLSYVWYFGDGAVDSTGVNPQHTYALAGKDTVYLIASANFPLGLGCRDTAAKVIAVDGPTGVLHSSTGTCLGSPVTLQVVSSNTGKYVFDFGDGTHSDTTANPVISHTFKLPGVYIPKVTLVTGNCYNQIATTDTIRVDSIQAAFLTDSIPVCDTTTVKLSNHSYAYFGIQSYQWVVNGTTYTGNTASQAFTQTGSYDVRLKVTGNSGCISFTQSQVYVYVHQTPAGAIAVSADTCARDSVYFTASVFSNDPVEYLWDFGNGAKGSGKDAATVFNPPGQYTVALTALTNFGCSVMLKRAVVINTTPDLRITPVDTVRLCRGDTLQLQATGNNVVTWGWGPVGSISCTTCSNPLAYPTTTTLYTVTGTNNAGCTGVDSIIVNAIQPITVSATPGSVSVCLPDSLQTIQFFASGAYTYTWSPQTWLNSSNIFNPVVNIPQPTVQAGTQITYTVTGYDQYHCSTSTADVVLSIGLTPVIDVGKGDTGVAGRKIVYQPLLEKNGPFKSFDWKVLSGYGAVKCLNGVCDSVQFTITGDVTFQVTAENIYGCTTTDTIHYSAFCNQEAQVFIPTGFSPDGDGINDVFMVQGKGIVVESFKIFNRWGQVVFDGGSNFAPNQRASGWNGTLNGVPVTEDVYVYIAKVKCTASNISYFTKGNVTLIRVKK